MNGKVDIIINTYKRHDLLDRQVSALRAQSIPIGEIYVWNNGEKIIDEIQNVHVINSPKNFGVWSRFFFAMNCESEYIAIFDDDTVPGERYFENCLNCFDDFPGIYGTRGLRFLSNNRYAPYHQYGWMEPNEKLVEVDIVGHNWFFRKEWLPHFFHGIDLDKRNSLAGEDIHLSFSLQCQLGVKTYVPPHPLSDQEMWGSLPEYANEYGKSADAISFKSDALSRFDAEVQKVCDKGFSLYYERTNELDTSYLQLSNMSRSRILKKIIGRSPILFRMTKRFYYWLLSKNIQL
jgi:hypothetical protein